MQASPTVLLYSQALVLVKQLEDAFQAGLLRDGTAVNQKISDILTQFENGAGAPMVLFDPVVETEPPSSFKMNAFWRSLKNDVSILQQQVDILRASSLFVFNFLSSEVQKGVGLNGALSNKMKVLQLYSDSVDSNTIIFGDTFGSQDFFDTSLTPPELQAALIEGSFLSLGQLGDLKNLSAASDVTVLTTSNGFAGNNQEVIDTPAGVDTSAGTPIIFKAETNRAANIKTITDDQPDTWFEFEHVWVDPADRAKASNLNFTYADHSVVGETKYVNWAVRPAANTLRLNVQLDLRTSQVINYITFRPFGLDNNDNFPVLVKLLETSEDGSTWTAVSPQHVWVGTSVNLRTARTADNITIGPASWSFQERTARYVRAHFEQSQPINASIGHLYYIKKNDTSASPKRFEGPVPPITNPAIYYTPNAFVHGDLVQKREVFNGKRWAIGIRDLSVQQIQFQETSQLITKPLRVGGLVDRVALDAEVYVPPDFDNTVNWVKFFVSPDDGLSWFPISRIQDDYLNLPEIIAFNDPTPQEFRDPQVAYYQVSNPVDTLRFKIQLSRPSDKKSSSPLVRSYKLKVRRR